MTAHPLHTSHTEARRLLDKGFKLCALHPLSKRPVGDNWQRNVVTSIDPTAGGYGFHLALNNLCSVDPDNLEPARDGMQRCGFSLEDVMGAGVRTTSTRPGSGGRTTFRVPDGMGDRLRWIKFSSKSKGTILELRAHSSNLQDCLPGTVYRTKKEAGQFQQDYANGRTLDEATEPPLFILNWWLQLSEDVDFLHQQQTLFCGADAHLSVSSGNGRLAFASPMRLGFNAAHDVQEILERHGYTESDNGRSGRLAPPTATGAPSVRLIPGKDGLWQSDHASDPLHGMFDAWTAYVMLDHGGDVPAAEAAWGPNHVAVQMEGFTDVAVLPDAPPPLPAFARKKTGEIKASKDNMQRALARPDFCGFQLRFDTFRAELMIAERDTEGWRPFRDTDYTELCLHAERMGFDNISKELIRDAVAYRANIEQFDSAQHWIKGRVWDGVPRLETFLSVYFGAVDTQYTRAVGLYVWTALAGRVMQPGVKCDMVPVAVGAQGARKSSAVAALVPDAAFVTTLDLGTKDDDTARRMRGKLVIELDELKGLGTRDAEHIKSLITRTHEEWTPKYREMTTRYARRCVFFGTSNKDDFLADETGNRRWLPFHCGRCDPDAITRDRDQLWAEALSMFNVHGVLHGEAERLAGGEHAAFLEHDEWDAPVHAWLHRSDHRGRCPFDREFLTGGEVLAEALELKAAHQTRPHQHRIKKVLIRLGYTYGNPRWGGRRTWGYTPPSLF